MAPNISKKDTDWEKLANSCIFAPQMKMGGGHRTVGTKGQNGVFFWAWDKGTVLNDEGGVMSRKRRAFSFLFCSFLRGRGVF